MFHRNRHQDVGDYYIRLVPKKHMQTLRESILSSNRKVYKNINSAVISDQLSELLGLNANKYRIRLGDQEGQVIIEALAKNYNVIYFENITPCKTIKDLHVNHLIFKNIHHLYLCGPRDSDIDVWDGVDITVDHNLSFLVKSVKNCHINVDPNFASEFTKCLDFRVDSTPHILMENVKITNPTGEIQFREGFPKVKNSILDCKYFVFEFDSHSNKTATKHLSDWQSDKPIDPETELFGKIFGSKLGIIKIILNSEYADYSHYGINGIKYVKNPSKTYQNAYTLIPMKGNWYKQPA